MDMGLQDKVAIITGGSYGIGKAAALSMAREGARVILVARRADVLDEACQDIKTATEGIAIPVVGDVSDHEIADRVVKTALDNFGRVDILVNNAGITRDNLAMRMKDDEWDQVIRINLEAAFRLMRAAARPMMKARHGRIISITSVVGATGNPGQMNYSAAKAGLTGMSKSLAQELATRGITVNCVAPGFIRTAMTDALDDKQKAAIEARIPAGRMGEGDEIGAAVAYLASDEAAYVTGQTLHVNGGMAMLG